MDVSHREKCSDHSDVQEKYLQENIPPKKANYVSACVCACVCECVQATPNLREIKKQSGLPVKLHCKDIQIARKT